MCRNGYLWVSVENFDTRIRFAWLWFFFIGNNILAIWRRFLLIFAFNIQSTILLLLVYLTYWPRKCHMFCPHSKNFHQVWRWYDHPLPSYSVLAADTLRDLVTLTCDLLIVVSGNTWWVTWSTLPLSLKLPQLSVQVMSSNTRTLNMTLTT